VAAVTYWHYTTPVYHVSNSTTTNGGGPGGTTQIAYKIIMPNGIGVNQNLNYQPTSISIKKSQTVLWTNNDTTLHTVTSSDSPKAFDSGNMNAGASYQFTFNNDGTFKYTCIYHSWMQGTVTVNG
jgi:plastocyanin